MTTSRDRHLGMDRAISRRDFMNGMAVAVGTAAVSGNLKSEANHAADPPERSGMRGSQSGSFETAHSLRDGTFGIMQPSQLIQAKVTISSSLAVESAG